MGQSIQVWTKLNLSKTAFWNADHSPSNYLNAVFAWSNLQYFVRYIFNEAACKKSFPYVN